MARQNPIARQRDENAGAMVICRCHPSTTLPGLFDAHLRARVGHMPLVDATTLQE